MKMEQIYLNKYIKVKSNMSQSYPSSVYKIIDEYKAPVQMYKWLTIMNGSDIRTISHFDYYWDFNEISKLEAILRGYKHLEK